MYDVFSFFSGGVGAESAQFSVTGVRRGHGDAGSSTDTAMA